MAVGHCQQGVTQRWLSQSVLRWYSNVANDDGFGMLSTNEDRSGKIAVCHCPQGFTQRWLSQLSNAPSLVLTNLATNPIKIKVQIKCKGKIAVCHCQQAAGYSTVAVTIVKWFLFTAPSLVLTNWTTADTNTSMNTNANANTNTYEIQTQKNS